MIRLEIIREFKKVNTNTNKRNKKKNSLIIFLLYYIMHCITCVCVFCFYFQIKTIIYINNGHVWLETKEIQNEFGKK